MVETLAPLKYGKVRGRFMELVGDGADPDYYPDAVPLSGTVTLRARPSSVLVNNAVPRPATVLPAPVVAQLDADGYVSRNGQPEVWVLASDDPSTNPTGFTYEVTFALTGADGGVSYGPFEVTVPTWVTDADTVDLTLVAPLGTSPTPGTIIIRGETGALTDVAIGTVTTLATGQPATAVISGTAPTKQLDLGLPKGNTGDKGDKGDVGDVTDAIVTNPAPATLALTSGTPYTRRLVLTSDVTLSIAAGTANKSYSITLVLAISTTTRTVTWPNNVQWPEGIKPALFPVGRHVINLLWDGAVWQGAVVGMNYA